MMKREDPESKLRGQDSEARRNLTCTWLEPFLIFVVALAARFVFLLLVPSAEALTSYDSRVHYLPIANNLYFGHGFSSSPFPPFLPDSLITPLYPYFLYLLLTAGIKSIYGMAALQTIVGSLSILIIYYTGIVLGFRDGRRIILPLIVALDPTSLISSVSIMTETLFTFLFSLHLLFLILTLHKGRPVYAVTASVFLALMVLTRPIALLYPLVSILLILLFGRRRPGLAFANSLVLLLVFYLLLVPWCYRNNRLFGYWELSSLGYYNLLMANATSLRAAQTGKDFDTTQIELRREADVKMSRLKPEPRGEFERNRFYGKEGLSIIAEDRWRYLKIHLLGSLKVIIGTEKQDLSHIFEEDRFNTVPLKSILLDREIGVRPGRMFVSALVISLAIQLFQLLFAIAGIVLLINRRDWLIFLLTLLPIAYFSLVTGPIGYSRYRVPIVPLIALAAAEGICWGVGLFKRSKWRVES